MTRHITIKESESVVNDIHTCMHAYMHTHIYTHQDKTAFKQVLQTFQETGKFNFQKFF